jgi:hypothetical protein
MNLHANQVDEDDDSNSNRALYQAVIDSTLSKRWREVSTLINKSTAAHIVRNAATVAISRAKDAANVLRYASTNSSSTVVGTDDDVNDDVNEDAVEDNVSNRGYSPTDGTVLSISDNLDVLTEMLQGTQQSFLDINDTAVQQCAQGRDFLFSTSDTYNLSGL